MFTLAALGLDTSHTVEFTKLIQSKEHQVVNKIQVVSALRFPSAFQAEEGQDERQAALEELGVTVTTDFDEAVKGVDGILLEINDPELHREYFEKAADLGLPVFIDKPLADTLANGLAIRDRADAQGIKVWSASSLRFIPEIVACGREITDPDMVSVFGALGTAAKGSSIVWYGVHTFEMLMTLMKKKPLTVLVNKDELGFTAIVEFEGNGRGIVECNSGNYAYGGRALGSTGVNSFFKEGSPYPGLMTAMEAFFIDGTIPVPMSETLTIQALLEAAEKSHKTGKIESVNTDW